MITKAGLGWQLLLTSMEHDNAAELVKIMNEYNAESGQTSNAEANVTFPPTTITPAATQNSSPQDNAEGVVTNNGEVTVASAKDSLTASCC
jgi:hypothetical protein